VCVIRDFQDIASGYGPAAGAFSSIKRGGGLLEQMSDHQLLKVYLLV
jgi:hypothetical protein